MFSDHDNPSTAAAAAPAQDAESEKAKATNGGNPASAGASEVVAEVNAAKEEGRPKQNGEQENRSWAVAV